MTYDFDSEQRFLYDGWNLIAEYSAPSEEFSGTPTLQASYAWGLELSGTSQGAGGVGGLLSVTLYEEESETYFPAYDGNGNISAWSSSDGNRIAKMDYSPFGQLIAAYNLSSDSELLSKLKFGFSTKYTDQETNLYYYGYRYYDPVKGRWPSRDPIAERGGVNLYGFARYTTKFEGGNG